MINELKTLVEKAWEDRTLLTYREHRHAIEEVIHQLDKGGLRVAEPIAGRWHVNDWIKKQ